MFGLRYSTPLIGLLACNAASFGCEPPDAAHPVQPSFQRQALDCAWLESNNCWRAAIGELEACVTPVAEPGLSAGNLCLYDSGEFITTARLPDSSVRLMFTGGKGQRACAAILLAGQQIELDTRIGITRLEHSGDDVTIHCPDRSVFHTSEANDVATACNVPLPHLQLSDPPGTALTVNRETRPRWSCE